MKSIHVSDGAVCTKQMSDGAQRALNHWLAIHTDEIARVLKPFDLEPIEVAAPDWIQLCTEDHND